ncbi:uncharacterized protein LOC116776565 [Danaus plexippus]|uniref:uncharacterized protein LOC116776565 n=1 Tax=Danaus plexippus TaxID=13037 RepID=UPI0013C3F46D|nr:uncharacterized protein LOC116776565 [Danaus plexippus plexippus]XP_061381591.1 uncharacterized protein LOC116776565 [Danaus plexippus]XP_061381592.1 uncharacterized protein LOC116776565 [Danaus plexippus]
MGAILNMFRFRFEVGGMVVRVLLLLCFAVYSSYGGGCTFPPEWTGSWFQSGVPGLISINSTHIQSRGECSETESYDKFLLYDRSFNCYKCMVIHEKHKYVLQYKETFCSPKNTLSTICEEISGDAPLYSMFRKEPRPEPQPCPFHPAPFTFTYSRGLGDCVYPPSRAESCTDDSRLLLRYMACPDVPGTESNVEELVCLATWKEGSTRYLVGQISQVQRRNSIASDEDTYRCFIYKGQHGEKSTYIIAQSGDATCNGLSSPTDGSRTMKLTTSDDEHTRCHFPSWIVEHHKWFSLDHTHQYHFTTKNATLKVMNADGSFEEKRLVCHSILEQKDKKHIKLVAHVTRGCESGHVCLSFHYRVPGAVLELRGGSLWEAPQDACSQNVDSPYVTLITTSLTPMQCPIQGRYSIVGSLSDRRRRRQQLPQGDEGPQEECVAGDYDSISIGCGHSQDTVELKSSCSSTMYTCYGGWQEGSRGFLVAAPVARGSSHPRTFCFMYTHHNESSSVTTSLSAVSRSCDRSAIPGRHGDAAYNLTSNGTCQQSSQYNSSASRATPLVALLAAILTVR